MVKAVLKSRQFWTMLIDLLVKLVVLFLGRFAPPDALSFWNELWAIMQVFVLFLISVFTVDDAAMMIALSRGGAGVGSSRGIGDGSLREQAKMLLQSVWK